MYRRTIEVNPFSSKSINSAIMSLRREKKRLTEDFKREFLDRLGLELAGRVDLEIDHEDIYAEHTVDGDKVTIRAYGEGIAFIEFGAGVYADNGEFNAIHVQFYPGSWSEDHARTYQEWVENGMVGEYRYNQEPVHSFDTIIRELDSYIRIAADYAYQKVYGK